MAKVARIINGVMRMVTTDQEASISNGATSASVSFPATLQGGSSTPRVVAWMANTTDTNPQFQEVVVTARSSTGFTATWNAPTDSANYVLLYMVLDGWVA